MELKQTGSIRHQSTDRGTPTRPLPDRPPLSALPFLHPETKFRLGAAVIPLLMNWRQRPSGCDCSRPLCVVCLQVFLNGRPLIPLRQRHYSHLCLIFLVKFVYLVQQNHLLETNEEFKLCDVMSQKLLDVTYMRGAEVILTCRDHLIHYFSL